MNTIKTIVHRVNEIAPTLTGVLWGPFQQDAILEFSSSGPDREQILLQLDGIHFLATRQSLLGGPVMDYPEERKVDFFGIFNDSAFLQQFMTGEIQHCGQIIIYDMQGRIIAESSFAKPVHVNVNCSDGILDVVCESVMIK
ncbi:MAG: hypothetical protein U1E05_04710 [Patescibacteria group bacterium]|nr:hypothetical protein [Patescibacteria group bacterium]